MRSTLLWFVASIVLVLGSCSDDPPVVSCRCPVGSHCVVDRCVPNDDVDAEESDASELDELELPEELEGDGLD